MDRFIASIRRKYKERLLNREEQWPPVRGDRLINLQLVEGAKEEGFRAGLPQHGASDDKVKRTPILLYNLFKVEEGKKPVRKLIVEGNAGIGKTTLCTMLAEGWAEGKILTQFDCVLLLPLRENRVSSATNLTELFKLFHSSERIRTTVIEELEEREGEGVLIIADGWDELSEENHSKMSFLYDFLFGDVLTFASVLLTSRPSASAPLHNLPSVDRLVEVTGFNEDSIKQYIASEFEHFPEKASSLMKQLENNPVIQSVCSVPLNCAIVCNLWHTLDQELPHTLTELYTQIVLSIILRNVKKKFPDCPISLNRFDEIPNDLQDTFWFICEFAYECLLLDQLVFSEAELSSRLPEVGDKLHCFGLLQSARSLLPVGHGLSFHFAHLTIQEFLAALHLATLANEEKLKVVMPHAKSGRFSMVWRFMFGLTSKYNGSRSDKVIILNDSFMDQFLVARNGYATRLISLCHVAFESLNPRFSTKVGKIHNRKYSLHFINTPFDFVTWFYVLRHAAKCDDIDIMIMNCAIDDKLLKELTDILSDANSKLQVRKLCLQHTKLSDKGVANLLKKASAAFTTLGELLLTHNNFTDVMSSFINTSYTSLTFLDLSDNPLGVSGMQSLETAVQSGALINLKILALSETLTDDADVNGALLTTLLQSIDSHCTGLEFLNLLNNDIGLPGLCSVVENIPLRLNTICLGATHLTTSFHSESQYTVTYEMLDFHPNSLTKMDLTGSNFGTLSLAKFLQAFQSLERLSCSDCSLTSADIIMLIHHLKSAKVICKNLKELFLRDNSIDDEGVIALTECLPELFPRLNRFGANYLAGKVDVRRNPVSEELIDMCNKQLKESRNSSVLTEWERTCLPPQNEEMNRTFHSLWDTLLSEMIRKASMISSAVSNGILSWPTANKPVEYNRIVCEVVDTVDTPSDVTDPDTLINEQSFSQASPVEHHPTASEEATCTTALQSTHRTDQHATGASGPRTVTIEELKECTPMRSSDDDDDDDDSIDSWYSTNEPVEHQPIDEVVDTVDTPSDVTDPDTLINEQSFSQASPVELPPTASDEATCTTALQSTHKTERHTTASAVLTDAVPSDVTEEDTSQDVLTSYPHTIPSGAGGPRTVTIEELKERTQVTDSQLDTEIEDTDLIILADHFDNIETYSTLFELTNSKKQDIIDEKMRYNTQAAMSLAMKLWKRRNPAAATYRALVEIVLSLRKVDVATTVCEFLTRKSSPL
ncbi:protein NLRC3-like isoform X2 [Halichondria panicea]|uniref:protein NLRC3-like isoform X2 n=1 Tax=Halichondria panicea TaxID=6063 RepID=UPI00312B4643